MFTDGAKILCGNFGWYKLDRTFTTNISKDYLTGESSWDNWASLRECIQNALDEAQYMAENSGGDTLDYIHLGLSSKALLLRDKGRGVDFDKILLIGYSGKRGTHFRGEKGEGQILSFLTFAKVGIKLQMFSQDWMAQARFVPFEGNGHEILALDVYKSTNGKRIEGTAWRIPDPPSSLKVIVNNIGDYFPDLSRRERRHKEAQERREDQEALKQYSRQSRAKQAWVKRNSTNRKSPCFMPQAGKPPRLYLKGIYVSDLTSGNRAMFSYNLDNVAINRDRNMLDQSQLVDKVSEVLGQYATWKMVLHYWKHARADDPESGSIEYAASPLAISMEAQWLKAFHKVYGKKVCLLTNVNAAGDAQLEGFTVVHLNPLSTKFAKFLGVKYDTEVGGFGEEGVKMAKNITVREQAILDKVHQILPLLGIDNVKVSGVYDKILGGENEKTDGFCDKSGRLYIKHSVFGLPLAGLVTLQWVIHEAGHAKTGAGDFDRTFVSFFTSGWVNTLRNTPETLMAIGILVAQLEQL